MFVKGNGQDCVRFRWTIGSVTFATCYRRLRRAILHTIIKVLNAPFALYGPSELFLLASNVVRVTKRTYKDLRRLTRNRHARRSRKLISARRFLGPQVSGRIITGNCLCHVRALICRGGKRRAKVRGGITVVKSVNVHHQLIYQRHNVIRDRSVHDLLHRFPRGPVTRNLLGFRLNFAHTRFLQPSFGECAERRDVRYLPRHHVNGRFLVSLEGFLVVVEASFVGFRIHVRGRW